MITIALFWMFSTFVEFEAAILFYMSLITMIVDLASLLIIAVWIRGWPGQNSA